MYSLVMSDPYSVLTSAISHRPYPLAEGPWVMRQTWSNLLFAHWSVPVALVRQLVPEMLELDLFEGQAYVGVVPFEMHHVAPRHLPPVPWLSYFPELNVRLYVRYKDQPGVYFLSLDAGNSVAVWVARTLYHLPYYNASMRSTQMDQGVKYVSDRRDSKGKDCGFEAFYKPTGAVFASQKGTLEHFLTERYCLYTTWAGALYRGEIHHLPWPLQRAYAEIGRNNMTAPFDMTLEGEPHLLFARSIDTIECPIALVAR